MGLGGYLAAKTDVEHYASELDREYRETVELPEIETEEVAKVFRDYGLSEAQMAPIVSAITRNQKSWVDFMMRFELGLEAAGPSSCRPKRSDDCGVLHRGWPRAAGALHPDAAIQSGAVGFGWRDAIGSVFIRRGQGVLHRCQTSARRERRPS